MILALLLLAVGVAVLIACLQHARERGWKAPGLRSLSSLDPRQLRRRRAAARVTRPADDLPPAGLTPLVPSPRVIANECERGLRELTLFLAVQSDG